MNGGQKKEHKGCAVFPGMNFPMNFETVKLPYDFVINRFSKVLRIITMFSVVRYDAKSDQYF